MQERTQIRIDPDVAKDLKKRAKSNFRSISKEASEQLRDRFRPKNWAEVQKPPFVSAKR